MRERNYEYKDINTKFLCIDHLYQRDPDGQRINKILKEFRPELVNAIKVSFRDGKYWVFDGQHTMEVLKAKNKGRDCIVECKVYDNLTWLDECDLFLLQNGNSRSVNMNDKFKARMNRGDADVVRMVNLAQDLGIRVDFSKSRGTNKICALTTLNRIFNSVSEFDYIEILSLIRDTWNGDEASYSSEILKAMYIFVTTYKGQYNRKAFVDRCSRVSPTVIIREGKASTDSGFAKYTRQILKAYNAKAKNRLPDLM